MAFLQNDKVLAFCRTGALLERSADGRVLLCTAQGRDIGSVDPALIDSLAQSGVRIPVAGGSFHALRLFDDPTFQRLSA